MILIDSNVLMYAAGTEHRHKEPSAELLRRIALGKVEGILDAEVLQEILHRYRSIRRWEIGHRIYRLARRIFPVVVPITAEIVDDACVLLGEHDSLMARDAIHAAACRSAGAEAICSYDKDFDTVADLRRVEPDGLL